MNNRSNTLTIEQHSKIILEADRNVQTSNLRKAELIVSAIDQLGDGKSVELARQIGMSKSTLSRWQSVGRSKIIQKNRKKLPSAFGTLYQITLLETWYDKNFSNQGADRVQKHIDRGEIENTSERKIVEGLIDKQVNLDNRRDGRKKQKLLEAMKETEKIDKPSTLQDFIRKGDLFHTIVVYPNTKQISSWSKLDFPVDIGDAYPIHDLRKRTDTASVLCALIIPRSKLDLGMNCIIGWGFSYKDVVLPVKGDDVVILGVRGSLSKVEVQLKSTDLNETLRFAESVGVLPRIVIGKTTDRKDWVFCNG